MGRNKKYEEERVSMNFKLSSEARDEFNKISKFSLFTNSSDVMRAFVENFIEEWKVDKTDILRKYFKINQ